MGFIRLHTLRSWFKLPENDKKQHQIEDCDKCQSIISNAILHTRSASEGTTELYEVCTSFFEKLRIKYPSTSQNSNKRAEQVLSVLEPIIESNFNESIKKAACKKYKLTPKLSSSEKQKEKIKVLRENNNSMTKILGNKENDVTNFLSSSKSFSQYNKKRMDTFFVPKSIAETNVQKSSTQKAESQYRDILQLSI
jgi:hypothetical protein